ncbi:calcium-binding protein [Methylobacterium nodulans]|uniref:Hemolysin-type calcium-binding region n=1 Tax=Methylobacterium nodulans (strain LMG 21967 / CNCM I-2342 / ORS 2060) TaxID=460265 RepID=B8IHF8_METNO|nr:hemolysin-type calcium-binding protein [Methylobacterium nodulans]ACL61621.1 Hemolysin-type calcium-binding region [Methylobacterium nodulans ORS 2060]
MAVYYVDSAAGSDSNNGASTSTAFASIAKVNSLNLQPGDQVLFKAGCSFSGTLAINASGTSTSRIVIGSYGTGADPVFSSATTTIEGGTAAIIVDGNYVSVSDIKITSGSAAGIVVNGNWATVKDSEITGTGTGILVTGENGLYTSNYVHDTIMVRNTQGTSAPDNNDDYGATAFSIAGSHNEFSFNTIDDCKAASYDYGWDGGAFEIWKTVDDIYIHDNTATDSCGFIETGGETGDTVSNLVIQNNLSKDNGGFLYFHNDGGTFGVEHDRVDISYNTIIESDPDAILVGTDGPVGSEMDFHNNIVVASDGASHQGWVVFNEPWSSRSYNFYEGDVETDQVNGVAVDDLTATEVRGDVGFVSSTDFHTLGTDGLGMGSYGAQGQTSSGTDGNDAVQLGFGSDVYNGGLGNDTINGGLGNDTINGGGGNDVIEGGAGFDWLTGSAGSDTFVFNGDTISSTGIDHITDLNSADDMIDLGEAFSSLSKGTPPASEFRAGTDAQDPDDYLIYDQGAGRLWYDADGNGGGYKQLIATFERGTYLDRWNFWVF